MLTGLSSLEWLGTRLPLVECPLLGWLSLEKSVPGLVLPQRLHVLLGWLASLLAWLVFQRQWGQG